MNSPEKKYTFHVDGMHCNACVLLTESEIGELPGVTGVKASLGDRTVEVTGDFGTQTPDVIAAALTAPLAPHGYTVTVSEQVHEKKWSEFKIALPITLVFVLAFVVLQKIGLVHLVGGDSVTYGSIFLIGVIASLSTCMAVVGGLVLSLSATFAKEGDTVRPQLIFHIGRLVSFFFLGGVIGAVGSVFTLSTTAVFVLSLLIGVVMLILGINLLDVFDFTKRLQPSMPRFITKHAYGVSKWTHTYTPLLAGIATFFLPCGFTQSMQLYTLGTGTFMEGGLTMLVFALGTLPVLALVSFSSFNIQNSPKAGIFFKTAGLIVILFAVFNLINSMVAVGIIPPVFNF